ncbi:MAG: hypothetical protein JWQ13_100 [Ramlibacter sp.]|jgi:hypothetical protein|nr:hypothetical protein [Ramlibacter sp.]
MKFNTLTVALALAFSGTVFAAGQGATTNPTPDSSTKMQGVAKQGSDAREAGNPGTSGSSASASSGTSGAKSATAAGKNTRHATKKSKKHHASHAT